MIVPWDVRLLPVFLTVVSPMSSLDTTKWVRLCSDLGRHFLADFLSIFRLCGCRIKASGITRESKGLAVACVCQVKKFVCFVVA